jgi:hypothetical protein
VYNGLGLGEYGNSCTMSTSLITAVNDVGVDQTNQACTTDIPAISSVISASVF